MDTAFTEVNLVSQKQSDKIAVQAGTADLTFQVSKAQMLVDQTSQILFSSIKWSEKYLVAWQQQVFLCHFPEKKIQQLNISSCLNELKTLKISIAQNNSAVKCVFVNNSVSQ